MGQGLRAAPQVARLRRELGRFGRQTAGASAVEFAFVVPVLLILMLGAIDGGRAMLAFNTVEKLAKDGARYASVRGSEHASPATQSEIRDYVRARATGLNGVVSVNVNWLPDNNPGSTVDVAVSYPFDTLFLPFNAITFNRTATLNIMR